MVVDVLEHLIAVPAPQRAVIRVPEDPGACRDIVDDLPADVADEGVLRFIDTAITSHSNAKSIQNLAQRDLTCQPLVRISGHGYQYAHAPRWNALT